MLDIIALQLLEALIEMHEKRVLHCDLKPSNMLLCFDINGGFIVKLCDFGLSTLLPLQTRI
jgi:serine/threonine protein kinase